jgi:hypothetical protein
VLDDGVEGFVDAHALLDFIVVEVLENVQKYFVRELVDSDRHGEVILMTDGVGGW